MQTKETKTEIPPNEKALRGEGILAKMRDLAESDRLGTSKDSLEHGNWINGGDHADWT